MKKKETKKTIQPVSGTKVPRFAGPSTFARLPELRDVKKCDIAIVGIPFDAGTSYRPGARFGPQSIWQASRHLRTNYHPDYDSEPFVEQQVADAGDIACNPFNINEAIKQIETGATELLNKVGGIISMGGDHTIAFPLLKSVNKINNGPVALVHFDAHLDTWDTYFGAPFTHGTPFRRAREENLFLDDASMHVGIRGPLYSRNDLKNDASFGFKIIHCDEFQTQGTDKIAERIPEFTCDFIGRFENINEDFNKVCLAIGIKELKLPHAYNSKTFKKPFEWTDELKEKVYNYYKKDFELFYTDQSS